MHYNFCRPHTTQTQRAGRLTAPAMAAARTASLGRGGSGRDWTLSPHGGVRGQATLGANGRIVALVVAACVVGCGGDSSPTTPDGPRYVDISGSYSAAIGTPDGFLSGTLSFNLTQNRGDLSGTYAVTLTATTPFGVVVSQGAGVLTGTVQPGADPSVRVTVQPTECPSGRPLTLTRAAKYPAYSVNSSGNV